MDTNVGEEISGEVLICSARKGFVRCTTYQTHIKVPAVSNASTLVEVTFGSGKVRFYVEIPHASQIFGKELDGYGAIYDGSFVAIGYLSSGKLFWAEVTSMVE